MPPNAPSRMTGIGASTPRPIISGFRTLSRQACGEQQRRIDDRRPSAVVAAHPDVDNHRQEDEHGGQLGNAQHQDDDREQACQRDSGHEQYHADREGLDQGHADDTLRDRTNGRRGQRNEPGGALPADDPRERSPRCCVRQPRQMP